ncbi:glycoside hydrolase family 16 protein [Paludibacter sp.]|uniref:glycoside hydrolase family 16 protein n=1 Tax=Paludibacter sp. TaxID=1898105 RepID=UPI0013558B97|nr:glycoside hydrolase family 16 protein [Paludibacter sp.]MTK54613.1 glycoside hydrolase family 16 protein [Paludibacter sp.]
MKRFETILLTLSLCVMVFGQTKMTNNAMSQKRVTPKSMGYSLVWEDQFNGKSLDTTKWNVRGVGPRRIGYNSAEAVKVEDGYLKLYALQKGDSILGSAVGTANHFQPKYGYFECQAKLQESIGVWAAFWIQSPEIFKGEDPARYGTEMDIFEFFKEIGTDTLTHSLHWAYGPHMQSVGPMKSYLKGLSKGFHVYGFEWTPEKYAFFIDGYKFYEETRGISNIPEYMILSMELPETRKSLENTVFPDVFVVDWVKVYQKK